MFRENDPGTEAEALESQSDGGDAQDLEQDIQDYTKQYNFNKKMKVKTTINCPVCCKSFIKERKNQIFPSGHTKCKDRYWNTTDETRRERAIHFMR